MVTYTFWGDICEIVSLDSNRENIGIGSALLKEIEKIAIDNNCKKMRLITTNDNTSKKDLDEILDFINCETTRQIQLKFDTIQGKYGKDNFSQRYSPKYIYLCSLVANFFDKELSEKARKLIKKYSMCNTYLLYEI